MTKTQSSPVGIQSINSTEDREIKDYWFEKLYKQLLAKARFILTNDQYSEDVVHDFYLKLLDWPVGHFQGKTAKELSAYIAVAFKNHCKDVNRKNNKLVYDPDSLEKELLSQVQTKSFEQELIEQEGFNDLLSLLTPEQRNVVLLWIEGHSHQEIADKLKISPTDSSSRLDRAKNRARKKLPKKTFSSE
ncbi:MAG TPA: sigma-70 family RNA polymerase sigma factor [Saprospiraceae bacterium]|nr:sigma-70 family RNA polymerase sigma factor [Saprospiraceae bacterium]